MTLRQPITKDRFDLSAREGWLRIKGGKSLKSLFDQSVLLRRQEAFVFEAETMLEFYPEEINHWAGMLYRYSENNLHYVYVSYDDATESKELLKITYDDGRFSLERITPLFDNARVWIKLSVDHDKGQFYYSLNGVDFLEAGVGFDASKLSDEYNRPLAFTGAFVGMGCQDLSNGTYTADFKYFKYTELE